MSDVLVFLSDIHSNQVALDAAVRDIEETYPSAEIVCCGDIVGALGNPEKTVQTVKDSVDHAVFGNHDARIRTDFSFVPQVWPDGDDRQLVEHRIVTSSLTEDSIEWLSSLPETLTLDRDGYTFEIAHANAFDEPYHGYPAQNYVDKRSWTKYASEHLEDSVVAVMGHIHKHGHLDCNKFDGIGGHIVNPGSVGSPYDHDAMWAAFDTSTGECSLHRTRYPEEEARKSLERNGVI